MKKMIVCLLVLGLFLGACSIAAQVNEENQNLDFSDENPGDSTPCGGGSGSGGGMPGPCGGGSGNSGGMPG